MAHPLKTYRARHDLTLEAMAELIRVSVSTLSRIENSKAECSGVIAIAIETKTNQEVTVAEIEAANRAVEAAKAEAAE